MSDYKIQHLDNNTLVGVTLSSAYDGTGAVTVRTEKKEKADILISYSQASGESDNTLEMKLEHGPTETDLYRDTIQVDSGNQTVTTAGERTFVNISTSENKFAIPVDVQNKHMKVSLKETGVANTAGTASVKVMLSGI